MRSAHSAVSRSLRHDSINGNVYYAEQISALEMWSVSFARRESLCHHSLDGKFYYAEQISTLEMRSVHSLQVIPCVINVYYEDHILTAVALRHLHGLPPKDGNPRHQPKTP